MSVDFSNVKIGDRIKLTRENGDEVSLVVEDVPKPNIHDKYFSSYWPDEWDALEILEKPLPTNENAVVGHPSQRIWAPYIRFRGQWYQVGVEEPVDDSSVRFYMNDGFEVLYEGLEYDA